jgi:hypothetical protein
MTRRLIQLHGYVVTHHAALAPHKLFGRCYVLRGNINITQPSFAVPAELRDFAEKGVEQSCAAFIAVLQSNTKARAENIFGRSNISAHHVGRMNLTI